MAEAEVTRCGYVAIVGRPNVGKSTLLNRLVGQKLAITSHKPQTTRHSIIGVDTVGRSQIVYVDTPGIHTRGDKAMNRYLNRTAKASLSGVDLILFVVQAGAWTEEDDAVLQAVAAESCPVLLVVNKVDEVQPREALLPYLQATAARHDFREVVPVSALKGDNTEVLRERLLALLPENPFFFPEDQVTDRNSRFFAAELIREQLTRLYHKELPYALTVEIERFEEQDGRFRISAVIWVERPGQKNILIGKQGQALKQVGIKARKAMQEFFEVPVHLDLWVKVKKSWSSDESALAKLGYSDL